MNSAFPRIVHPVTSDARRSLIRGVLPMAEGKSGVMGMGSGLERRTVVGARRLRGKGAGRGGGGGRAAGRKGGGGGGGGAGGAHLIPGLAPGIHVCAPLRGGKTWW